jgi:hypothetical protein
MGEGERERFALGVSIFDGFEERHTGRDSMSGLSAFRIEKGNDEERGV